MAAALGALLYLHGVAAAESGKRPQCAVVVSPEGGGLTPQNLPAISLVGFDSTDGNVDALSAADVSIESAFEVRPDPRLASALLLVPTTPLKLAQFYDVPIRIDCPAIAPAKGDTKAAQFVTGPPVALPVVAGTAKIEGGDLTRIVIAPSEELHAFRHVTLMELFVEDELWAVLPYGYFWNDRRTDYDFQFDGTSLEHLPGRRALCSASEDSSKNYRAELRFHVAGADVDPAPLPLDLPLRCRPVPSPASAASTKDTDAGCAIGAVASSSPSVPLAGLSLAVLAHAARVRRRRSRTAS